MNDMDTHELKLADESSALAHVPEQDPIAHALAQLMSGKIDEQKVAVMERLSGLYLSLKANDAEKQFAAAFNRLQSEMPAIHARKPVPNRDGTVRYKYAPYEEIRAAIDPLLRKHGFSLTFSSEFKDSRVVQTCTIQHVAGHKRSNSFGARTGNGPPGSSDAQGDGAASSYAKRFALCDCLGIVIETDTDGQHQDARAMGDFISKDKIQFLRESVAETGGNEAGFFALAGVTKYEEITEGSYTTLVRALELKKKRR